MKDTIHHIAFRTADDEWEELRNLARKDRRSLPSFLLNLALTPKEEKKNKETDDNNDPDEFLTNPEDIKPLYGTGYPDDVAEQMAEMQKSQARKAKKKESK